jgi:hypothetical protein
LQNKLLQDGSRTLPEQSYPDMELCWSSLCGKGANGEEFLQSSRSTLEQIPVREILLQREILG